jgi:hypothetical protein
MNDLREHEEATTCPCGPVVECEPDAAMLVIHNSFDGREALEQAEMILHGEYQNSGVGLDVRLSDDTEDAPQ